MGWLRDLMASANPRPRSFDELARSCVESADWPELARMAPRSLSALFSKLDRDENIGWLAGRPEVQLGLARVLGTSRETVRLALTPKQAAEPSRFVTLDALPYGRVLDLVEEPLFPGVPGDVLRPGSWERLVWLAPSGGGRSLVGRWLEARGLAEHVAAPRIADAALPVARPLYVELGSDDGLELETLAPGTCVALPDSFRPERVPDGVRVVRSPPLAEVLDELVAWCRARLSARTGLDPERFLRFLRAGPLESGALESVGDVLGLAGLADAVGLETLETQPLARIGREFVKRRATERLDPDGPSTAWARRLGFDALVAIARRCFVEEEAPFLERTTEGWSLALPVELKHGPDLEWLRAALPGAEPGNLRSDVERAVTKLPPGAFRLLRTFETLGLLERSSSGLLALRPHWLVRAASAEALAELVDGPPAAWGEALLSARAAPTIARRLLARARRGELSLEELMEPASENSPVHAAAVEGAFRAIGLAAALGTEPPEGAAGALWDEALGLVFEPPGALPGPRIEHATLARSERNAWLLGRGAYVIAALALGERLEAAEGRAHALLRPWQATRAPEGLPEVLDLAERTLEFPEVPAELVGRVTALVGRLRSVVGPLGAGGTHHALERASIVADETALGVLAWSNLAALANDRVARIGTRHLVESRRLEHAFAEAVWQAHQGAGSPTDGADALFSAELAPLVARSAPDDALAKLVGTLAEHEEFAALAGERLPRLLANAPHDVPLALFERLPEDALDAAVALATRAARDDGLTALWQRFPDALSRVLHARLVRTDAVSRATLAALLRTAPPEATAALVAALDDVDALMKSSGETLAAARALLHARIAARAPGWRNAYALFAELEARCRTLAKSSLAPGNRSGPLRPPT